MVDNLKKGIEYINRSILEREYGWRKNVRKLKAAYDKKVKEFEKDKKHYDITIRQGLKIINTLENRIKELEDELKNKND